MDGGFINQVTTSLLHGQNQFAAGGLLLMVFGAIGAYLKNIPVRVWEFVKNQTTLSLSVNDQHESFSWFKWWFQQQSYAARVRNMDAFTPHVSGRVSIKVLPAPGSHWFFYKGRPLFIHFNRTEKQGGYDNRRNEAYYLWTFGRKQKYIQDLLADVRHAHELQWTKRPTLKTHDRDDWIEAYSYVPRTLESVVMEKDIKGSLVKDIEKFKESEKWYDSMGIPFHRGYVFYGPPGSGKTSLVTGLSSHFNCDVYLMKLSGMSDSSLTSAVSEVTHNSMIVMEDVDCVNVTQARGPEDSEKKEEKPTLGVTLSGLLNVLDGIQTPKGAMFFMTTNHLEKLDPALLRPGRADMKVFVGPASLWQKEELYRRFFPEDNRVNDFAAKSKSTSMAEYQEELMVERNRREEKHRTEEGLCCKQDCDVQEGRL